MSRQNILIAVSQGDLVSGVSVSPGSPFDLDGDAEIDNTDLSYWLIVAAAENKYFSPFRRGDTDDLGSMFDPNDPSKRTVDISDFQNLLVGFTGSCVNWECGHFSGDDDKWSLRLANEALKRVLRPLSNRFLLATTERSRAAVHEEVVT